MGAAKVSIVTDTAAVEAGKPFTAGVRFELDPTWYIYWQNAGDIGVPVSVEWELPAGFKAGPLRWPLPVVHEAAGDFLNYVYERETLLSAEITPPAALPAGPLTLRAKVKWQMCDPRQCVPGEAELALALAAGPAAAANAELFAKWNAQLPREGGAPFPVKWDRSKADAFSLRIEGLGKEYQAEFFPLPPPGAKPDHPKTSEVSADGTRTITFPVGEGGSPNLPWRGVLAVQKEGGQREGWTIAADTAPVATASPAKADGGLLWKLLVAFLGGLIMNVMPCVLPVIALKIFGFVNQAGEAPQRVFRLGLAFTGGVFAFFLGLAAAVARLKSAFNWGYQFQNLYLLVGLTALVFVFALSLLGVFEVALSGGASAKLSELSRREGYGGAFLHGFFTTLLGTSCTAPFLSTSLGFAVTQSTPVIFLFFIAIAGGMSLPYFLLTAKPAWLRYVPKPGAWMERAKQLMGFAMLAVVVWLLGVLGVARGAETAAAACWFLLALALACWLFGTFRGSKIAVVLALTVALGGWFVFLRGKPEKGGIAWQPYSEEALAAARKRGEAVFVDFTAEWCVNCKAYERLVLETPPVRAKFVEKKITALRADWTNADPVVTRALKSFGRVGVPLYVLYRPGETEPLVLDAITPAALILELDRIRN